MRQAPARAPTRAGKTMSTVDYSVNCSASDSPREAVRKIAIFRALYLGDMLLAIPALRSLRTAFAQAEITFIGLPWAEEFVRRFGYVDRFLEFPGFAGLPEVEVNQARTEAFLRASQAYGYDLAIQMHGNGRVSNLFIAALGARKTLGFATNDTASLPLSASLPYVESEHEIAKCLRLARLAGASDDDPRLEFPLTATDLREATRLAETNGVRTGDRLIGLHVGAKHPARRWPVSHWIEVADRLASLPGVKIVLTGSQSEKSLVDEVAQRASAPLINLAGQTTLGGLAALIARARLFVSADSGPGHLASALGTSSVLVFGKTDPNRWGPLDQWRHHVIWRRVPCSPCDYAVCPTDHRCLTSIRPDTVLAEALQLLSDYPRE